MVSHGRHHGAQKSTITGTGEARTSSANVTLVTWFISSGRRLWTSWRRIGTFQL
jgi:hypothetical protein